MRFSIFFLLVFITIVSVGVYGLRLSDKVNTTQKQIELLREELAQFPSNLERNVKLMRSAMELPDPYRESVRRIQDSFKEEMQSRIFPEDFQATTAMACNTSDPMQAELASVRSFHFFCPEDRAYVLEIKRVSNIDTEVKQGLLKSPDAYLSLGDPIKIELPAGISQLVVTTDNLYGGQKPTEVHFELEGKEVAMIWCKHLFNAGNDYLFSPFAFNSTISNQHRIAVNGQPVLIAQAIKYNIQDNSPEKRNVMFGIQCWLRPNDQKESNR